VRRMRGGALLLACLTLACARHAEPDQPLSFWQRAVTIPEPPVTPRLSFIVLNDIPLPGPLPEGGPRLLDDRVRIPVAGGVVVTAWSEDAEPELLEEASEEEPPADSASPEWALDPMGKYRAGIQPGGRLITQKRCGGFLCRGWKRAWRLRVPGVTSVPPLITENRVYFGAKDNLVYSLRKKNGHRVWSADLGQRVSTRLILWDGEVVTPLELADDDPEAPQRFRAILVRPDRGAELIALDARNGSVAATFQLEADGGKLKGLPLSTPDGRILLAREKYNATEASLLVLALSRSAPPPEPGDEETEPDPTLEGTEGDDPAAAGPADGSTHRERREEEPD